MAERGVFQGDFMAPAKEQPRLNDLLFRFFDRRADDTRSGLRAESGLEVEPHDSAPVQPADARLAWSEAMAAGQWLGCDLTTLAKSPPPEWTDILSEQASIAAAPFCVGNFPQLVRSFGSLLETRKLADLRRMAVPANGAFTGLLERWSASLKGVDRSAAQIVLAGLYRLTGQFEEAHQILERPVGQQAALENVRANEWAALAWHRGFYDEAAALWKGCRPSVPVSFNRGMAALFSGGAGEARTLLQEAANSLSKKSSWHHLAKLYLALADIHS
jgi:hypothetical protein